MATEVANKLKVYYVSMQFLSDVYYQFCISKSNKDYTADYLILNGNIPPFAKLALSFKILYMFRYRILLDGF